MLAAVHHPEPEPERVSRGAGGLSLADRLVVGPDQDVGFRLAHEVGRDAKSLEVTEVEPMLAIRGGQAVVRRAPGSPLEGLSPPIERAGWFHCRVMFAG